MERSPRGLGLRLIAITILIVAVAAVVVGVVVTKLSEDDVKQRLMGQVNEMAHVISEVMTAGGQPSELTSVLLRTKLRSAGAAWILERNGQFLANPDPRFQAQSEKCVPFGDSEIELTAVSQSLAQTGSKGAVHKMPLKVAAERYGSGLGILQCLGEPAVVAFRVLPERGWIVGVDEPYSASYSSTASLKKYILITCGVLGLSILLSTAISISYIIKPYYRQAFELTSRVERANRNLKKLHDVSVGLQKSLALEDRIQKILGAAHEVLGLDRIFIFQPAEQNTILECKGAFGNEDESPEQIVVPVVPEGAAIAQAYLKRRIYRVPDSRDLPKELRLAPPYSEIKALRSRAFVVLPMIVGDECVGVVAVDNRHSKAPISDEVIEVLELFTNQAAVAIENAELYLQLKLYADELEITDHLTQLFTFFHFKKVLQDEIGRARVGNTPLFLAVVSVDDFARYNELLGHRSGDAVLREVARVIQEKTREQDVIGRCFGCTFAVMFRDTSEHEARRVLETVVAGLEATTYVSQEKLPERRFRFLVGFEAYRRGEGWTAEDFFAAVKEKSKKVGA